VVRPGVDLGEPLALVVVSSPGNWAHINVDRYLAGRIGQVAAVDLSGVCAFRGPTPSSTSSTRASIDLGAETRRSSDALAPQNPIRRRPGASSSPSPTRARVAVVTFSLGPDQPSQVAITINRVGLPVGQHSIRCLSAVQRHSG
jgi:hypothetical protein